MNIIEKRDFIHKYLHKVKEPALNDIYLRMIELFNESLIEESEEDILKGNLIDHESLKHEILNWKNTK
jgi:predicted transcriptional regulator